eukprot:10320057-Ditylum_brightwellii.AAC.1
MCPAAPKSFHERQNNNVFPSTGFDDGDDNLFGDAKYGIGFDLNDDNASFGDMDNGIVECLDGIYKVEKSKLAMQL